MKVAILENLEGFLPTEANLGARSFARLEAARKDALFGDDVNPLDGMGFFHGVVDAADVHDDLISVEFNDGNMLLLRRICGVRLYDRHWLAAAGELTAAFGNFDNDVSALRTLVER